MLSFLSDAESSLQLYLLFPITYKICTKLTVNQSYVHTSVTNKCFIFSDV